MRRATLPGIASGQAHVAAPTGFRRGLPEIAQDPLLAAAVVVTEAHHGGELVAVRLLLGGEGFLFDLQVVGTKFRYKLDFATVLSRDKQDRICISLAERPEKWIQLICR